jgi:Transglycosylase SLT domain
MPVVPQYGDFKVEPSGMPEPNMAAQPYQNFAAQEGEKVASGIESDAHQLARIQSLEERRIGSMQVDMAKTTMNGIYQDRRTSLLSTKGVSAFQPTTDKDGQSIHPTDALVSDFLSKTQSQIDAMPNDWRKEEAINHQAQLANHLRQEGQTHEVQEAANVNKQIISSTQYSMNQQIAGNPTNYSVNDDFIRRSEDTLRDRLSEEGLTPQSIEQTIVQNRTEMLTNNLKGLIKSGDSDPSNIDKAYNFYQYYKGRMNAEGAALASNIIIPAMESHVAQTVVDAAYQENGANVVPYSVGLSNAVRHVESGDQHYDQWGGVLKSNKGAVGVMQVMPDTAKTVSGQHSIPWNEELFNRDRTMNPVKDEEAVNYNKQLGNLYLSDMMKRFANDPIKAEAAYNAGPGKVEEAIKEDPQNWLSKMPKETQDYVRKVEAYRKANPTPVADQDPEALANAAIAKLPPSFSNNKDVVDLVQRFVSTKLGTVNQQNILAAGQAGGNILRAVNAGTDPQNSSLTPYWAELQQKSPSEYASLRQRLLGIGGPKSDVGPFDATDLMSNVMESIRSGKPLVLNGQGVTIESLRPRFTDSQYNTIVDYQRKIQTEEGKAQEEVKDNYIKQIVNPTDFGPDVSPENLRSALRVQYGIDHLTDPQPVPPDKIPSELQKSYDKLKNSVGSSWNVPGSIQNVIRKGIGLPLEQYAPYQQMDKESLSMVQKAIVSSQGVKDFEEVKNGGDIAVGANVASQYEERRIKHNMNPAERQAFFDKLGNEIPSGMTVPILHLTIDDVPDSFKKKMREASDSSGQAPPTDGQMLKAFIPLAYSISHRTYSEIPTELIPQAEQDAKTKFGDNPKTYQILSVANERALTGKVEPPSLW